MSDAVTVADSDVGLRRACYHLSQDDPKFVVVVDKGVGAGYVEVRTDWRSIDELRSYAQMLLDAVEWLET
jgi:hypothetical protein